MNNPYLIPHQSRGTSLVTKRENPFQSPFPSPIPDKNSPNQSINHEQKA